MTNRIGPLMIIVLGSLSQAQSTTFEDQWIWPPPSFGFGLGWGDMAGGDVNGDGVLDLVAGAPYSYLGGGGLAVLGPDFQTEIPFSYTQAESSDYSIPRLCVDLNGDGYDDVISTSAGSKNGTQNFAVGRAWVVYGPDFTQQKLLRNPYPTLGDQFFGSSVAVMDWDHDGLLDVLVGARGFNPNGRIDVFSAATAFSGFPIAILQSGDLNVVASDLNSWGNGLLVDDFDSDGQADVLTHQGTPVPFPSGMAYLKGGVPNAPHLIPFNIPGCGWGEQRFLFTDVTGDGARDIITRAYCTFYPDPGEGGVILLKGPGPDYAEQIVLKEPAPKDSSWGGRFGTGDANRDGHVDVIASAGLATENNLSSAGRVRILYGPGFLPDQSQKFPGITLDGQRGASLVVHDWDNDGFAEIAFGAPGEGPGILHVLHHRSLRATGSTQLSVSSGGSVPLSVECGALSGGELCLLLVSFSGALPGFELPAGAGSLHLALNPDALTTAGLSLLNGPVLSGFFGLLDAYGMHQASLNLSPGMADGSLIGQEITVAGLTFTTGGVPSYATHALGVALTP